MQLEEVKTTFRIVPDSYKLSIVVMLAHVAPLRQLEKHVS